MAVKNLDQRVGVFVDVSNMYYSAKNLYNGAKLDFGQVLKESVADRKLIRAIAYVIKADIKEEQNFFDALERAGYEVKSKDLQIFMGGAKKGDWDVGITVDAIKLADKLDTVILVSGDGDYEPLINYLQENKGCYVEVYAFGRTASNKIIEKADEFHDLDENADTHLIKPRRTTRKASSSPTGSKPSGPIVKPEAKTSTKKSTPAETDQTQDNQVSPIMPTFFSTAINKKDSSGDDE